MVDRSLSDESLFSKLLLKYFPPQFKRISRYRVRVEDDRQVGPALRRRVAEHEEGDQAEPQEGERQD